MYRARELRRAIKRSEIRLHYTQTELARFMAGNDPAASYYAERTYWKLVSDLQQAQSDVDLLRHLLRRSLCGAIRDS